MPITLGKWGSEAAADSSRYATDHGLLFALGAQAVVYRTRMDGGATAPE